MDTIRNTTLVCARIDRCFDLSLSIDLELEAANEFKIRAVAGTTKGMIGLGQRVRWEAEQFGMRIIHESEITRFERPNYFQDRMIRGVFRSFEHDHFFHHIGHRVTEMRDVVRFRMPLRWLGPISERLIVRYRLKRLPRYPVWPVGVIIQRRDHTPGRIVFLRQGFGDEIPGGLAGRNGQFGPSRISWTRSSPARCVTPKP
jgi:ligand-binding SRPBCC domain-containing protein